MQISEEADYLSSFGRRRGRKLKAAKQKLFDELLPTLRVEPVEKLDLASLYDDATRWWLEIGYGGGEHLAAQAKANPDIGFLGCEPYVNGIASLLEHIDNASLKNVRIFTDDARMLLDALPESSLERVFILFPDPWRKQRHHKRRLVSLSTLEKLARVVKKGGLLRLATDHVDYASWMLEQLLACPYFTWNACRAEHWKMPPVDWVPTRYEQKARADGRPAVYYDFIRT